MRIDKPSVVPNVPAPGHMFNLMWNSTIVPQRGTQLGPGPRRRHFTVTYCKCHNGHKGAACPMYTRAGWLAGARYLCATVATGALVSHKFTIS